MASRGGSSGSDSGDEKGAQETKEQQTQMQKAKKQKTTCAASQSGKPAGDAHMFQEMDDSAFLDEYTAAQARVSALERDLITANAQVSYFKRELRRRTRADLAARFSEEAAPAKPTGAAPSGSDSRRGAYGRRATRAPVDMCPACWSEAVKGWPGGKHDRAAFAACRLNRGLSLEQFQIEVADGRHSV